MILSSSQPWSGFHSSKIHSLVVVETGMDMMKKERFLGLHVPLKYGFKKI